MLVWLAVAVVGAALVVLWPRGDLGRRVRLPDGTVLELKKVTVGTNHQFRYRSGWEQLLGVLPDKWEEKITKRKAMKARFSEPLLAFWLMGRDGQPTRLRFTPYLCDDIGIGTYRTLEQNHSAVASNRFVENIIFNQFPRRSKTLTLHFYDTRPGTAIPPVSVAQFTVANPFHTTTTPWSPEPLPISRRFEGVTVTLTECKAGVHQTNVLAPPPTPLYAHFYLHFRVEPQRERFNDWLVNLVKLSDASGNYRLVEGPTFRNYRPGDQRVVWDEFLFSDEPAWKIQVEFYQDFAPAKPEELRTIPDIPIAAHHTKVKWTVLTPAWFGALINVRALRFATAQGDAVDVGARIEPDDQGHHLKLIEARDAEGRIYQPDGGQGSRYESAWIVKLPTDAKTATLTFHLRQGHWEEFLVRPEFPFARAPGK
jgi:hypothetical protein